MYRYETHLHTYPVSHCAKSDACDMLRLYKELGYDGVFITNHFLDGNINIDKNLPYEQKIRFFFADYENAKRVEKDFGIKVFCGIEMSHRGTDFLVYGLDKEWFLLHPEIMDMKKTEQLPYLIENGALVIQAHPFREASYIDHIRLFPRSVHGIEILNACRTDFENEMARIYCEKYSLIRFAGTDIHNAATQTKFAGVECEAPIENERDFVKRILEKDFKIFSFTKE